MGKTTGGAERDAPAVLRYPRAIWAPVRVHVSIHDVSPRFRPQIELALELARAAGVKPALLVVPNFHGQALLTDDREFCGRLRALQRDGHEVFLHGFFHASRSDEPVTGSSRERRWHGPADWFAQRIVSAHEAEFADLSRAEAKARLDAGQRVLEDAGLRVDGFVAPAWSMPAWLLPILAARACTFTEDHLRVYDPAGARSRPSLVLNYASRTPARLLSTVAFCRIATPLAAIAPARVAIHPSDMRFALLRKEIARLLEWGKRDFVRQGRALLD
jgi:hypothetical protein